VQMCTVLLVAFCAVLDAQFTHAMLPEKEFAIPFIAVRIYFFRRLIGG
jgi:hypothetical protein